MTIGKARAILSGVWIFGSAPLILIITIQTIMGVYDDWDTPWSWLTPFIFPLLSLIVTVWTVSRPPALDHEVKEAYVLWAAVFMSLFFLLIMYAIPILGRMSPTPMGKIMKASVWYLSPLQALVTVLLGKFFIENID
jgi:hypothetical protein